MVFARGTDIYTFIHYTRIAFVFNTVINTVCRIICAFVINRFIIIIYMRKRPEARVFRVTWGARQFSVVLFVFLGFGCAAERCVSYISTFGAQHFGYVHFTELVVVFLRGIAIFPITSITNTFYFVWHCSVFAAASATAAASAVVALRPTASWGLVSSVVAVSIRFS